MNENNMLVSVIIVTRDRLTLLNRAVESVFSQKYKPIEIIVIDNFSEHSPVLQVSIPPSCSVSINRTDNFLTASKSRNYGIQLAKGKYICFLDDDDYYLENKVDSLVDVLSNDQNIDMVYGNTKMIGPRGADLGLCKGPSDIVPLMLYRYIHLNSLMIKKSLLTKIKFDETMTTYEDVDFTFRLLEISNCVHLNQDVAVWNRDNREDQLTKRNWARSEKNWLILCNKFEKTIKSNKLIANMYYKKIFLLSLINFSLLNSVDYLFKYLLYGVFRSETPSQY